MAKKIEVNLTDSDYNTLSQIAKMSGWSLEKVVLRCIKEGMPPSLGNVPEAFHDQLISLNALDDRDLFRVIEGKLSGPAKKDDLYRKADYDLLRKTYALSLLRWRGHPIPMPPDGMLS